MTTPTEEQINTMDQAIRSIDALVEELRNNDLPNEGILTTAYKVREELMSHVMNHIADAQIKKEPIIPTSMTMEEAQQKVASRYGFNDWPELMADYIVRISSEVTPKKVEKEAAELYLRTNLEAALQSQWISVSEKMPENIGIYLCITIDNLIIACHVAVNGWWSIAHFGKYYGDMGRCVIDSKEVDREVTHWMPIPPFKP